MSTEAEKIAQSRNEHFTDIVIQALVNADRGIMPNTVKIHPILWKGLSNLLKILRTLPMEMEKADFQYLLIQSSFIFMHAKEMIDRCEEKEAFEIAAHTTNTITGSARRSTGHNIN